MAVTHEPHREDVAPAPSADSAPTHEGPPFRRRPAENEPGAPVEGVSAPFVGISPLEVGSSQLSPEGRLVGATRVGRGPFPGQAPDQGGHLTGASAQPSGGLTAGVSFGQLRPLEGTALAGASPTAPEGASEGQDSPDGEAEDRSLHWGHVEPPDDLSPGGTTTDEPHGTVRLPREAAEAYIEGLCRQRRSRSEGPPPPNRPRHRFARRAPWWQRWRRALHSPMLYLGLAAIVVVVGAAVQAQRQLSRVSGETKITDAPLVDSSYGAIDDFMEGVPPPTFQAPPRFEGQVDVPIQVDGTYRPLQVRNGE